MRIRSHLLLLTAVVLIPATLAAGYAVDQVRQGERRAALAGLRESVRATALLVDADVQRSLGALTALAQSSALKSRDLATFYYEATAAARPPDVWTLLLDESGTQLINTARPFGAALPSPLAREQVARVLASGQPLVTDVIPGSGTGELLTTIYLPAATVGGRRHVVAQAFSVEHWKKVALRPPDRPDWIVGVLDRQGKFVSRSHQAEQRVGTPARPELVAAAAVANEGLIRHATLEGINVYDAFTHSALTGWTIAVAAPIEAIEATATAAVLALTTGMVLALFAAGLGASFVSRLLIGAMATATNEAQRLGEGIPGEPSKSPIDEVNTLNAALATAGRSLAAEKAARELVETERTKLLANESRAREIAQHENAAKDKFIALLGHELRNPLSAITGATEVLLRMPGDAAAAAQFLPMIRRQNQHLTHIVNDLLETGRMLSGKIKLNDVPLDLGDCVATCIESLRVTERAVGHILSVQTSEVWIHGDAVRIEQIVNNLVVNAMKASQRGDDISVSVRQEGRTAVLEVFDQGGGISAELLPHVFEPFLQGPLLPGQPSSGLGVGLALVKQLAELHGGSVCGASDGPGLGARFTVRFPRIESPIAPQMPAPPSGQGTTAQLLLVEDNPDARQATSALLRLLGYVCATAASGEQALEMALIRAPDVVLMDLGLPGKSGFEMAALFRQTPALRHIGLIALSGYGQEGDRSRALASGFDEHLIKPVDPGLVSDAIEARFHRYARA